MSLLMVLVTLGYRRMIPSRVFLFLLRFFAALLMSGLSEVLLVPLHIFGESFFTISYIKE